MADMIDNLRTEFQRIKREHQKALVKNSARAILGASVIRVFDKGAKDKLRQALERLPIADLTKHRGEEDYRKWFDLSLSKVSKVLKECSPPSERSRIYPGYKWGHAAKVLNLFVREVVENKRYFTSKQAAVIRFWLHVPIDSRVIERLRHLGVNLPFDNIKQICTRRMYYEVQDLLKRAADAESVPRVWFDDVWAMRD